MDCASSIPTCGFRARSRLIVPALQHPCAPSPPTGHWDKERQSQQEGCECEEAEKPLGPRAFPITSSDTGESSAGTMGPMSNKDQEAPVGMRLAILMEG